MARLIPQTRGQPAGRVFDSNGQLITERAVRIPQHLEQNTYDDHAGDDYAVNLYEESRRVREEGGDPRGWQYQRGREPERPKVVGVNSLLTRR